jgi:hypothetical protein
VILQNQPHFFGQFESISQWIHAQESFFVTDSRIEATDICSLQLLLSGETVSKEGSECFVNGFVGNVNFERLFLNCPKGNIRMNLSELTIENRIDFESSDVSVLSVESLDGLLLSESSSVESEDSLLRQNLKLGPSYRNLVRHIQISFLSAAGLSLLDEHFDFPPESV